MADTAKGVINVASLARYKPARAPHHVASVRTRVCCLLAVPHTALYSLHASPRLLGLLWLLASHALCFALLYKTLTQWISNAVAF